MGVGEVRPPADVADRVIDLGFLDDADRDDAFAAAAAYVQPSRYESFSRTVMEAWLAGTLVVANGASAVVRWPLRAFRRRPALRGRAGARAVPGLRRRATRGGLPAGPARPPVRVRPLHGPAVLDRVEATLEEWTCAS